MTVEGKIREGVNNYIDNELRMWKRNQGVTSLLGEVTRGYIEAIKKRKDTRITITKGEAEIDRKVDTIYTEITQSNKYVNAEVRQKENEEKVREIAKEELKKRFKKDRETVDRVCKKGRYREEEDIYIDFLKDIDSLIPDHVVSTYILDLDITSFTGQVYRIYREVLPYVSRQKETYYKLFLYQEKDPISHNTGLDISLARSPLVERVHRYLLGELVSRNSKRPTINSVSQYSKYIEIENKRTNNLARKLNKGKEVEGYKGILAMENNFYPQQRDSGSMREVISKVVSNPKIVNFKRKSPTELQREINKKIGENGVSFFKVNQLEFVFGKELYILKHGDERVYRSAYSNVKHKEIEAYIERYV